MAIAADRVDYPAIVEAAAMASLGSGLRTTRRRARQRSPSGIGEVAVMDAISGIRKSKAVSRMKFGTIIRYMQTKNKNTQGGA